MDITYIDLLLQEVIIGNIVMIMIVLVVIGMDTNGLMAPLTHPHHQFPQAALRPPTPRASAA